MTVSGLTMTIAALHSVHARDSRTQRNRSPGVRTHPVRSRPLQHVKLVPQREHFNL